MTSAAHIRNDGLGPMVTPLHIGPSDDRIQVTLARGYNKVTPEDFERIAGRRNGLGEWTGGSMSKYFNAGILVEAHAPPSKDPVHVVERRPGAIRTDQSNMARRKAAEAGKLERAMAAQSEQIAELTRQLARQGESDELRKAREDAEIAELLARKAAAEASLPDSPLPTIDPRDMKISEVKAAIEGMGPEIIAEVMRLEALRPGGPRPRLISALTEALKG